MIKGHVLSVVLINLMAGIVNSADMPSLKKLEKPMGDSLLPKKQKGYAKCFSPKPTRSVFNLTSPRPYKIKNISIAKKVIMQNVV